MKHQKEDERAVRERIRDEVGDKAASSERNAALVFKYMNDKKRLDALFQNVIIEHTANLENKREEHHGEAGHVADKAGHEAVPVLPPWQVGQDAA